MYFLLFKLNYYIDVLFKKNKNISKFYIYIKFGPPLEKCSASATVPHCAHTLIIVDNTFNL